MRPMCSGTQSFLVRLSDVHHPPDQVAHRSPARRCMLVASKLYTATSPAVRLLVALVLFVGLNHVLLRTVSLDIKSKAASGPSLLPRAKRSVPSPLSTVASPRSPRLATTMSLVKSRAKAAILGGFVADAATMPLHWIYDVEKIKELVGEKKPEFFDPPSCPFYTYELGNFSPYGDEILPLLRSVAKVGGFESEAFAEESYSFLKEYKGRLNHVSKLFVEARDGGKPFAQCAQDDSQAHGIIKVPILVARYAGKPELASKVEAAVRVHQDNDVSVAASTALAKVLEKVILGSSIKDAFETVEVEGGLSEREHEYLHQTRLATYPSASQIKDWGMSCALPADPSVRPVMAAGALLGASFTAYHATGYEDGVRSSTLAGGDNCSRNIVVGAILAAAHGVDAIPSAWRSQTKGLEEISQLADQIIKAL